MKLEILQITDAGVPNQERLHLRVLEHTNLSYHLVISSAWVSLSSVANGAKSVYWFPPQDVKPNDEIVLYTRGGTQAPKVALSGATTYFYFWGEKTTIWNARNSCALVFDVATWGASVNPATVALAEQLNVGRPSYNALGALMQGADNPDSNEFLKYLATHQPNESNTLLGGAVTDGPANSMSNFLTQTDKKSAWAEFLRLYGQSKPKEDDDSPQGHF